MSRERRWQTPFPHFRGMALTRGRCGPRCAGRAAGQRDAAPTAETDQRRPRARRTASTGGKERCLRSDIRHQEAADHALATHQQACLVARSIEAAIAVTTARASDR